MKSEKTAQMSFETGEQVELILTDGSTVKGSVIQVKEKILHLKLKSGYNAGIGLDQIKEGKRVGTGQKMGKAPRKALPNDPKKPTIVILHTGGTIASRVDYKTGAVTSAFDPEDLLAMYPELFLHFNVKTEHISNMWSDDLRFGHYTKLAKSVESYVKKEKNLSGIIIGHGTDTMHYTAAALSFMLQNVPIPVILVGAQRSSDRPSSDARINLTSAAQFIHDGKFQGVAICMHENENDNTCVILLGTHARKLHTSRRDAFKSINVPPLARIQYPSGQVDWLQFPPKKTTQPFNPQTKMASKVGILKIHTNMHPEVFAPFEKFDGLVLEGTGLGHAPTFVSDKDNEENEDIKKALQKVIAKGCVVVMTSQCIHGRVNMNVYSKGVDLQKMGVIPGSDQLTEVAFVKLAWALGNFSKKEAIQLMSQNISGEMTDRFES